MTSETIHPNLAKLLNSRVSAVEKGVPQDFILSEAGKQNWNLLKGDLPLPLALLKKTRLEENGRWMRRFADRFNVNLAPHGKTTMSPQLFAAQMNNGAWGLTAATIDHVRVYRHFGHNRILMANQLIGRHNITWLLDELEQNADFEFYCLVDSAEGAELLQRQIDAEKRAQRINVLIELGIQGGRTGMRSDAAAIKLAEMIRADCPNLSLCGVECYEGVLPHMEAQGREARVADMFARVVRLAETCIDAKLFQTDKVIVSGAGSEYYDIASKVFSASPCSQHFDIIIRAGCYISQDHLFYNHAFKRMVERDADVANISGQLSPALEVWGCVQSLPEAGLAVLNIGKRDVSFDFEMPKPILWFRSGSHSEPLPLSGHSISRLNDQHAYCETPEDSPLRIGDMIAVGVAHPCTTFDKWRNIFVVDDDYTVSSAIRTYF